MTLLAKIHAAQPRTGKQLGVAELGRQLGVHKRSIQWARDRIVKKGALVLVNPENVGARRNPNVYRLCWV